MNGHLLYLEMRSLPLERSAELAAAHDAGLNVVIATRQPAAYEGWEELREGDCVLPAPTDDHERAEEVVVESLAALGILPLGVLAWADQEVELAARVSSRLDLPGSRLEAARAVRDKGRTRRLLDGLAGANPRYRRVRDRESFLEGLAVVGVPSLLKPRGASFGRGIYPVDSMEGAAEVFDEFQRYCDPARDSVYGFFADDFLLEEKVVGTEHSVSGLFADGQVVIFGIADKEIDVSIPFQYQNIVPSLLPEVVRREMVEQSRRAVQRMEIDNCGFHIDFIVSADGPKILEIGGRLGGEGINSHLIPLATQGVRPYDHLLRVAQGLGFDDVRLDFSETARAAAGLRAIRAPGPGVIRRIDGVEQLGQREGVLQVVRRKQVGDRVRTAREQAGDYAVVHILAAGRTPRQVAEILEAAEASVVMEVDGADGPLG